MKKRSLLLQLILPIFVFIVIILATISAFYYATTSEVIEEMTVQRTKDSIHQASTFISSYISKLRQTTESLVHNQKILAYLTTQGRAEGEAVFSLLESILHSDADFIALTVVEKHGKVISTDEEIDMKLSEEMLNEDWYKKAVFQSEMLPVLLPAHLRSEKTENNRWIISVAQEISDEAGHNMGVLRLDISYQTIAHYLDKLALGKDGFTFIFNENHEFVYHPENTVYISSTEMKKMEPYFLLQDNFTENKQQYVYQNAIDDTNWTLTGVASLQSLHLLREKLLFYFLLVVSLALVISYLFIWYTTRLWLKPLKSLQKVMLDVSKGQHSLRASEQGSSEIIDLSRQFNAMLDKTDLLMKEIKENEQSIRMYELNALTGQINPHFLYNTLDTIIWMAEFGDSEKVVQLTKSLAKYFRIALNKGNELIRLQDEIEHVRQYLYIQKERYGDILSYEIFEAPEAQDFYLPKLVLQPLVENAIYHGIKPADREGKIVLRSEVKGDFVILSLRDNGVGIKKKEERDPATPQLREGGIGMSNVDKRLRLHFGSMYHMDIQSRENEFTEITLYLPRAASEVALSEIAQK